MSPVNSPRKETSDEESTPPTTTGNDAPQSQKQAEKGIISNDNKKKGNDSVTNTHGTKRKAEKAGENQKQDGEPAKKSNKTSESSTAPTSTTTNGSRQATNKNSNILKSLLSPNNTLHIPNDELQNPSPKSYFSTDLNPFENLLSAIILSRPISHTLGIRTIRTVLNEPWSMNILDVVLGYENEEVVRAMEEARTQHRVKTAEEVRGMAAVVKEKFCGGDGSDGELGTLREMGRDEIRRVLKKEVKGMGDTGVDIFLRKVQVLPGWESVFPFVDKKTEGALVKVGLVSDDCKDSCKDIREVIDEEWDDWVSDVDELKGLEKEEGKTRCFGMILERALGIVLEGKEQKFLESIGS